MNINLIAPLNQLGYGVAGQNVSLELNSLDNTVALFPVGPLDVDDERKAIFESMKVNAGFYDIDAPCLRIWHQDNMSEFVGRGLHVGFPFFELDRFNAREIHHLNHLDRLFVASKWAAEVASSQISTDIRIVPLGVDRGIFHERVPADRLTPDFTVFANVGKWERRKGHDILLRAFNKAFRPTDKVVLKMLCYNPFIGPQNNLWAHDYSGSPMGRNIVLSPRLTNHKAVARFLAGADCGVFPARAEGWNLELLEMMAMGKHVICTHVTAHTEFADENNSRLIHCEETEPAEDGIWFHGQGDWAHLGDDQEEQLIAHLREIHSLKQTGKLGSNDAGIETGRKFSWTNTANLIIKGLQ